MAGLYTVSGNSIKTMSIGTLDSLMDQLAFQNTGTMTAAQAMYVPLAFRAIDLIAGAVSRMPYYIEDERENDVTEENTPRYFSDRQYKLAASLLLYNAAYALKEKNQYGYPSYRFLPTPLVSYELNPANNEIEYFEYRNGATTTRITDYDRKLMWWWWPNLNSEVGPGTGPTNAALGDIGLADSLTKFAESYFKRGGFPLTILRVEGNPPDSEKILAWWNGLVKGARKAFRAILLTNKIEPKIIGSNIKDTIAPELYEQAAHNVSIAYGIPLSLLLSDAAHYATALEDHVRFYTETVIPLADRMFEVWNERVYEPQGLKIESWPEQLEVMQQYQLQTAAAVQPLVGKPVISLNEGREILGYEKIDDPRADKILPDEQPAQLAQDEQPVTIDGESEQSDATIERDVSERDDAIDSERKALRRYAHNRLRDSKPFAFRSDVIGLPEIEAVKALTTHDEIDAIDLAMLKRDYTANDIAALLERATKAAEALTA